MFQRLHDIADPVTFTFDGKALKAERGQTLAGALLASGVDVFRTSAIAEQEPSADDGNDDQMHFSGTSERERSSVPASNG